MSTPSNRFNIALISDPNRGAVRMSCENADCDASRNGWVTVLDSTNAQHAPLARLIENSCVPLGQFHPDASRRRYIKLLASEAADYLAAHGAEVGLRPDVAEIARNAPPGGVLYVFPPGHQCFRPHVDREVVFAHSDRGVKRVHARPLDFNEDFNETADQVNRLIQRG